MIVRFCLYSIFKNLRFFEPFFIIYLLAPAEFGGPELTFLQIGVLVGFQKLVTSLLEVPTGVMTDSWGRRRCLMACFSCYVVAFPIFAFASVLHGAAQLLGLYLAQAVFGVGEALRTGSHKAIILDWADSTGQSDQATRVIGLARFFSKVTRGVSAIVGAIVIFLTSSFTWLFAAATLPAIAGVLLVAGYPKYLEGERTRERGSPGAEPVGAWTQFCRLWAAPGLLFLFFQSVLFESQVKTAQHYIQPFLKAGLDEKNVAVIGSAGALVIGLYYLIQDVLGGLFSAYSAAAERHLRGGYRATQLIYSLSILLIGLVAFSFFVEWYFLGVLGFIGLAALQNVRRPILLSQLNKVMDKPQRSTTLSIESQGQEICYAILAPTTGWVADHFGLAYTFVTVGFVLAIGLVLHALPKSGLMADLGTLEDQRAVP